MLSVSGRTTWSSQIFSNRVLGVANQPSLVLIVNKKRSGPTLVREGPPFTPVRESLRVRRLAASLCESRNKSNEVVREAELIHVGNVFLAPVEVKLASDCLNPQSQVNVTHNQIISIFTFPVS